MRVAVIGTGYVGIVSGACLAARGHTVTCVDADAGKVERIRGGEVPIHEPGLDRLLADALGRSLHVTADLASAVQASEITLIAVGTPFDGERIDLTYVRTAAEQIGAALQGGSDYHVVAVKSTVVPGTTDDVVLPALVNASGRSAELLGVGMNPEFLTEGSAVRDFMDPDRIIIGAMDTRTQDVLAELYASFADTPVIRTNNATAEMIKYASNALLATMISFANEFATLSSTLGNIDAAEVMNGVHRSLYLSVPASDTAQQAPIARFLEAGCGFGGSCLPKDVSALVAHGRSRGVPMRMLQSVLDINRERPDETIALLRRHFDSFDGVRVGVLGLAFKPETDDVRESPAFPIIRKLVEAGATVIAHDPVAIDNARRALGNVAVTYQADLAAVVARVDALILVTRWDAYRAVPELVGRRTPQPVVVDGRRMLPANALDRYEGIGL